MFDCDQFRMSQLQVFNWGTFSGLHQIPIAERGFLFVGRSGAGKSTLLDAFSALLVPPRWVDFNAAAREADRSGRDRNVLSYLRGAWAEQKDGDSGEIATRYLRAGTTWSALALTYQNKAGQKVVLVQIFWVRGNANSSADVKRHYLIFEHDFDLNQLQSFSESNFDIRKLKNTFPNAFARDEFRPYCEHFSRLLGIESEMALRLLHKTQSAKNLGDLNTFLRDFMLDKPQTFEVAERLVTEFDELNAAHQAVVTARQQVQTLTPAREQHQNMQLLMRQRNGLQELQIGVSSYRETQRMDLLTAHLTSLDTQRLGLDGDIAQQQTLLHHQTATLRDLERQHRELGGDQIEQWENEKIQLENLRTDRLRKHQQAEQACRQLQWTLATSPQSFAELVGNAQHEMEAWQSRSHETRDTQFQLSAEKNQAEQQFTTTVKEVQALKRQASNIPAEMLELRSELATAIGVAETALPFVGELLEVKADEAIWQGAIERVLHGFALSLLVQDSHYAALTQHINHTNIGRRLVYYRTARNDNRQAPPLADHSLILKLNVKTHSSSEWLQSELRHRFDYACVESLQAFRNTDRALTREGQIKHNKTRHEKDDRSKVDDRRYWVLGFNNREKLALFEQQAQQLAEKIAQLNQQIHALSEQDQDRATRVMHCQTLLNLQWQEIDVSPLLERIARLGQHIQEARDGNQHLQRLNTQIEQQLQQIKQQDQRLRDTQVKQQQLDNERQKCQQKLDALQQDPSVVPLTPYQQHGLKTRFSQLTDTLHLENLDKLTTAVVQGLSKEVETLSHDISACEKIIENRFADFKRQWPMEAGDLDSSLDSASDFFAKLSRLETDGLPIHEQRFFELLQTQSHQNLAALSTYLNDGRKAIVERMSLVNDSLSQVPFNQTAEQKTFLHIDATDRQLPEVREFKQAIQQALSHAWSDDREFAEKRFLILRQLVTRLSSQEPEQKRWREAVLDVRLHVEFIGREIDEAGVEVEIYRSGAGKSGGQRQKLATTCLAAALRYQLGGNDHGVPLYAAVILDEAFDKADNEFTALAMNIFTNFGFQMIVATPLKSVMTLEPFIGGACFVDISDRRVSGVLLIEYDQQQQRLQLPESAHASQLMYETT
jgi:hypothetical protein